MLFDVEKIRRGKVTCTVEKIVNFVPNVIDDILIPTVTGQAGYDKDSIKLTTSVVDGEMYVCGFETFEFNMSEVLSAEFTVEGLKGLNGYYNMTVSMTDDTGNEIRLYTTNMTGTETRISTTLNAVTEDAVLMDKHNISGNPYCYYNFTFRIDKQLGRVELLHNGQMFGYADISNLTYIGKSRFCLKIAHESNKGKSVTVRQIRVRLEY